MQTVDVEPKRADCRTNVRNEPVEHFGVVRKSFTPFLRATLAGTPLIRNLRPELWERGALAGPLALESINQLESLQRALSRSGAAIQKRSD